MDKYDNETVRAYLLGKISDEETLAGIEESLFLNEDFTNEVELAEDDIINDYVSGNLSVEDREIVEKIFFKTPERQFNLKLTQELNEKASLKKTEKISFLESLKAFFGQPAYAGAFAVLLIVAIGFSIYFFRSQTSDELAALQTIYEKDRPVEPRISEFKYAPLNIVRGAREDEETIDELRRIELKLGEAVKKDPSAKNHHKFGIFLLTQKRFADAIRNLKKAAALDPKNAKIANDLGSAHFESAREEPDKKLEFLATALENFSRATELDPNLLEALFNKSLCQQELKQYTEAKESWEKYLEKDPTSGWADEARKYLQRLENSKTGVKTKEQVLEDFLGAYLSGDHGFARKINRQTKEMITGVWLPDQLSRRILEARIEDDDRKASKASDALKFIGDLEKENADFFVADLAEYYSSVDKSKAEILLRAKNAMRDGYETVEKTNYEQAILIFGEAKQLMASAGNSLEEKIADFGIAQSEIRNRNIAAGEKLLSSVSDFCEQRNYAWLYGQILLWSADRAFLQNEFSKNIVQCKEVLKLATESYDSYTTQKSLVCLANTYNKIGELNQSKTYLSRIFAFDDLYYSSPFQTWRNYFYLARFFDRLQKPETAAGFARESLNYALENGKDLRISSLDLLANIYGRKKDFSEALRLAGESKNLAEELAGKGLFKQSRVANSVLKVADLKSQMGNCEAALPDYEDALQIYLQSEATINVYETHKGKLLCFQALNRAEELRAELEIVLNLSESFREKISTDTDRQAFFDNEQIVYDAAIENSLSNRDAARAFEWAESSKARSLLDFVEGTNSINELEKQFSGVSKPLSLAEIQARMPEKVQIVQFAVLREKTVIWTLTHDEIKLAKVKISEEDLERKIADYLNLVTSKSSKTEIESSGKELYAQLVRPILADLDQSKEICLIPDKALHQLPFAVLISDEGRFFLEDFKIFNSPSASVFIFATEKARETENIENEKLLSVGNPAFDREENAGLDALPSAEDEAKMIAKFYPNAKQFLGTDATKSAFLDEMPSAEIVHFAGHYVAVENPKYSKLLFADGNLRSFEIAETRLLKSKLIVLSACQTGIEKFYNGEGAIGIARTFLAVGTPLVLASRWQVDSEATKDLMIAFHRNRKENNLTSIEALRLAQIEMLKGDENFRQPYFWAAFSLVGASANY